MQKWLAWIISVITTFYREILWVLWTRLSSRQRLENSPNDSAVGCSVGSLCRMWNTKFSYDTNAAKSWGPHVPMVWRFWTNGSSSAARSAILLERRGGCWWFFSVRAGGAGIFPDGQLVLLALVDLPRLPGHGDSMWFSPWSYYCPTLQDISGSLSQFGKPWIDPPVGHVPEQYAQSCLGQVPINMQCTHAWSVMHHHLIILAEETSLAPTTSGPCRVPGPRPRNEWNIYDWKPDRQYT